MNHTAVLARIRDWPVRAFRRDPQKLVVLSIAALIAYLSLSPTLMLFYGSFLSKPLGVPGEFTLSYYLAAYRDRLVHLLVSGS